MSLSNSERQRKYRISRMGPGGEYERLSCLLPIPAKRDLERISGYMGLSFSETVRHLVSQKKDELLEKMDEIEKEKFYQCIGPGTGQP
ncbi:hypothetical protein [Cupriavidus basilensis]|uniref:Uncharacterized protein n=1 Tax=Cupriavidus basilensis TaxID=68895 RepID=A0A643FW73_9BURK|nr:hypothetical protein [Cupriavidus basilensis]MCP3019438.1 hypothetical protein [Cupriavidus basilensis]MDR3383563.1 hypothetical protein [Cupriavidus basilensis]QOT80626.1 hypothetical protein F7R26_024670 [Cupriavidus basilensis]